jgi:4a-hydroxytetrahydrobiopterin dehydratase
VSVLSSGATGWQTISRPPSLFARYQFSSYRETRAFLDRLAALSQETGRYPDLGFGSTYVNVTVHGEGHEPGADDYAFAARVGALASPSGD